ncbi:leptin-like [Sebastes umbrosus]|uniref:leptin-like n=1 Tax=Sebastes umbrosus TaxID=72105 RepID=UPI00189DF9C9|nr:leptin-like [Sebastes umbrosus]
MEPNSGIRSDIQPRNTGAVLNFGTTMDYTLALLFSLLHLLSVATAAPLPVEVVTMKSKVKWRAEQLLVRLNSLHQQDFQVPADLTLSPTADSLDGPSSIVTVLEGYNNLISDTFNGVSQIKLDITSLTGYIYQWGQDHCSQPWPKPVAMPVPLQELRSRKKFIHTVSFEALLRVKEFLNLLLKNLDQLETC